MWTSQGQLHSAWKAVLRHVERRGVSRDVAEDSVQQAFLHVVELRAGRRRGWSEPHGGYLMKAALNARRDDIRKTARRREVDREWSSIAAAIESRDKAAFLLKEIEMDQKYETLWEVIEHLSPELLWPLLLCDGEGYSDEHAARELGMRLGTLKSRKRRARSAVRRRIALRRLGGVPE